MEKATLDKVLEDMKHGVYNFTKNGKCTRCGNCCTALLPMTKTEIKTVQKFVKKKRIKIVKHEGADLDITCPFYDDNEKSCIIYEKRPFICRTFVCNKSQNEIEWNKDRLSFDSRYQVYNLREVFV